MTLQIRHPRILGFIDANADGLTAIADKVVESLRRHAGRKCLLWIDERGAVMWASDRAPKLPAIDDAKRLVGVYRYVRGSIKQSRIRADLVATAKAQGWAA